MPDDSGDMTEHFNERYRVIGEAAMRRAEVRVIGSDYGANSYSTKTQADRLAEMLDLGPGKRLLDVGSGAGWPGVYLAHATGCRVLLTDLAIEGLHAGTDRARAERLDVEAIVTSGAVLPLRDESVDAVTSSDAFC